MNDEEKRAILNVCREYSDISYQDDMPLTLINEIKHKIRAMDEIADPILYTHLFIKKIIEKKLTYSRHKNI